MRDAMIMKGWNWKQRKPSCAHYLSVVLALVSVLILASRLQAQPGPEFDSVVIDSLDPTAWNGIVFLAKAFQQPASFALRLGSRGSKYLVGNEIFNAVREVGPHAPDGSYCRVGWAQPPRETLVKLEWAKVDRTTVVGRLTAANDIQLVLETYFPFNPSKIADQGQFSLAGSNETIIGERF